MKRLLVIALLFAAACLFHQEAQAGGFGIFGGVGVSVRAPLVDVRVGGRRGLSNAELRALRDLERLRDLQRLQALRAAQLHSLNRFDRFDRFDYVPVPSSSFRSFDFDNCNRAAASFSYRSSVFGY